MISNEYLVSDRNSNLIKLRKRAEESNLTPKEEALFITMYARTKTGRKNQTYQGTKCSIKEIIQSTKQFYKEGCTRSGRLYLNNRK